MGYGKPLDQRTDAEREQIDDDSVYAREPYDFVGTDLTSRPPAAATLPAGPHQGSPGAPSGAESTDSLDKRLTRPERPHTR
jgi:hypothetical protein